MTVQSIKNKQQGLSLVELMIAMTLGLLLMSVVGTIMINSKRAYNIQTDMAGIQENVRFAMGYLSNDLRMAGYYGCTGVAPAGVIPVSALDNAGANDSDVVRISFMNTNINAFSVVHCPEGSGCPQLPNALEISPLTLGKTELTLTKRGDVKTGDTVIASDCGSTGTYIVTGVNNAQVKISPALTRDYSNNGQSYGAQLRALKTHRYFIGEKVSTDGEVHYSLYHDEGTLDDPLNITDADEMIEGVENMQLRYGFDGNGDGVPDRYVIGSAGLNWERVVSVRIILLMRTLRQRHDRDIDNKTFQLDAADDVYGPIEDHRRRALFSTTVLLRNNSLR